MLKWDGQLQATWPALFRSEYGGGKCLMEIPNKPFDKAAFRKLLVTAKGERTLQEYAKQAGVSRTYLSKYANERISKAPSFDVIKKLALAAHNGVSYGDFLLAAGVITTGKP